MASQGSSGGGGTSRLAQMQMRFQQKQQQEKEQRRVEITGSGNIHATNSARTELTNAKTNNIGNGKVRQMFDERRRGAGFDRSNPLKPLTSSSKSNSTPALAQKSKTSRVTTVRSQETVVAQQASSRKPNVIKQISNRSSRQEHVGECNNNNKLDSETTPMGFRADGDTNNNNSQKKSIQNGKKNVASPQIKLNPVLTKKSPPVRAPVRRTSTNEMTNNTPSQRSSNGTPKSSKPEEIALAMNNSNKPTVTSRSPTASSRSMASNPSTPTTPKGPPPEGMVACSICGRNFNEDRIAKHEEVCRKMANSKRKVYDASKHRVKGTDAEQFNKKKPAGRAPAQRSSNYISEAAAKGQTITPKKNDWRQKHEEFVTAIRAAKQVQAHLARGGKLSDLPPPPPSLNPDYIQCPHCSRRFNQSAAERHIPKCVDMLHNKPKPGAKKR